MNNKQVARELVKIAKSILADEKTLQDLDGAVSFSPKYHGISFIVAQDGIYKRSSSNNDMFRSVRMQDVVLELRLKGEDDIIEAIQNNWKNKKEMVKALNNTGRFRMKVIKASEAIFNVDDADGIVRKIESQIKAPHVYAEMSTLGGKNRASVIIKISLDPKSEWENNIFHNSRYFMIHLNMGGVMEQFTKSYKIQKKLRKSRVKSIDDAIKKLNAYISIVD